MVDNRESIYLDTISLASDYPNRKSMSLSRQTIYHSAEDMNNGNVNNGSGIGDDVSDYATPVSKISRFSNADRLAEKLTMAAGDQRICSDGGGGDEVSARLLYYDNVDKKMTVTYSQWKSRVTFNQNSCKHKDIFSLYSLSLFKSLYFLFFKKLCELGFCSILGNLSSNILLYWFFCIVA